MKLEIECRAAKTMPSPFMDSINHRLGTECGRKKTYRLEVTKRNDEAPYNSFAVLGKGLYGHLAKDSMTYSRIAAPFLFTIS
jgi:hypothetical protein